MELDFWRVANFYMKKEKNIQIENGAVVRPPIVVVMGHIDHGKTKILDYFRKSKVVESESGGITQHIGAYEVDHNGKKITFIDTPGHEAFSQIRSRGARVADIAILVIAAEEGIKPQTKEAIGIIKQNNLPFIVAINKIDKPEANPERVKQQLAEAEILVESYGGQVPSVEISAKMGKNMDSLLEMILILAELEDLKADPNKQAEGVVIEVDRDSRRGTTSTLLVLDGTLKRGDAIVIGRALESVKILENFLGKMAEELGPSSPARVAGLAVMPSMGDRFFAFPSRQLAEKFIEALPAEEVVSQNASPMAGSDGDKPVFNIILKADVAGSREALEGSLKKFDSEFARVRILKSGIGDINETDIKLAQATKLVTIIGFKVGMDGNARDLADTLHIRVLTGDVIYELLDNVKSHIEGMIPPEVTRTEIGRMKILKVFKKDNNRQIIGGRVEDGFVKKGSVAEIKRNKEIIGRGLITQLQREKNVVDRVEKGSECGMSFDSGVGIQEGDVFDLFEEEVKKRTLNV